MSSKRRSPVAGPLLTFALMIGSVAAVGLIAHYMDTHPRSSEPTVAATTSQPTAPNAHP